MRFNRIFLQEKGDSKTRRDPAMRARVKNELEATIPPEAIAKAGTYIVTLKSEGEALPESHRAHLVVGFKP